MTTAYAPDVAPELEPEVVRWQPTHPVGRARARLLTPDGAALALVALGVLALGAAVVGLLAAGGSGGGRSRLRLLNLGELDVGGLRLKRRAF